MHGALMRTIMAKTRKKTMLETYDYKLNYGCRMILDVNSDRLVFKEFIQD